jgi:hypothetical protein
MSRQTLHELVDGIPDEPVTPGDADAMVIRVRHRSEAYR